MGNHKRNIIRYILGYVLGPTFFVILIPAGIYYLSSISFFIFQTPVIPVYLVKITVSSILFIVGVGYILWSNVFLLLVGKGGPTDILVVAVTPRTKILVATGPYRNTRNPMVFGAFSLYFSLAIYFDSLGCFLVLALLFFLVIKFILPAEEKRLLKDFRGDFLNYKERTSLIIPLPRKKTPENNSG